jgi:hypothetical protein
MKRRLRLVSRRIANIDCDRPEVTLWVRTRYQDYARVRFIVDTAADFTGLPISLAQLEGIEFSRAVTARGTAGGLVGAVEKYLGTIQVRIAGEEFDWPCDFLELPAQLPAALPQSPRHRQARAVPVLGRAGFLAAFAIYINGDCLLIHRRYTTRPWWYRLWKKLLPARAHQVTDPL